jgi:hydroxyethylthiazole kinase-like uncharacterized protein yjeF
MFELNKKYIASKLKVRGAFTNKSDYGHALIIAGQMGYMGAAVITAKAGLRAGLGLLTVCVPREERYILQTAVPEAMLVMREENLSHIGKFSVVGMGPGMGTNSISEELLIFVLKHFKKPILLDADALTIISNNKNIIPTIAAGTIITPHIGEFDRLFGMHQNKEDRLKTAVKKAKEHQIIIVLKDHCTAIVSKEKIFFNTTGNSGLAKGGSGDALTGIITSFLAQGYSGFEAANIGVYLHGLAADISLKKQSKESMIITDVIDNLGKAFKKIRK